MVSRWDAHWKGIPGNQGRGGYIRRKVKFPHSYLVENDTTRLDYSVTLSCGQEMQKYPIQCRSQETLLPYNFLESLKFSVLHKSFSTSTSSITLISLRCGQAGNMEYVSESADHRKKLQVLFDGVK